MKIIWLGTGSAFTLKNYHSNFIIEHNGKKLLIDAGTDIRHSLNEQDLDYTDIDAIYISHLHADHAGGLEYLAFCSHFDPSVTEKITLLGNDELLKNGWKNVWSGGLGVDLSLDYYFNVIRVPFFGTFNWEGISFKLIENKHTPKPNEMNTFGLLITSDTGKIVYYTGDSVFNPNDVAYQAADLIIQDCETYDFKSGVHANYQDLKTLPEEIKKKMMLIHYADNDDFFLKTNEELRGFIGFAKKGRNLDV